jgi:hypothetical protein
LEKGDGLGDCVNDLCGLCDLFEWFYVNTVNSVTC